MRDTSSALQKVGKSLQDEQSSVQRQAEKKDYSVKATLVVWALPRELQT